MALALIVSYSVGVVMGFGCGLCFSVWLANRSFRWR